MFMNVKVYRHRACKATTKCRTRWNGGTHGPAYPHPHEERDKVALHCGDESNESDVAAKAASLLSRGAAGRVAQLQFQMMCERPPRSLRSRLPLTRGRLASLILPAINVPLVSSQAMLQSLGNTPCA